MKKFLSLLIVAMLVIFLVGCEDDKDKRSRDDDDDSGFSENISHDEESSDLTCEICNGSGMDLCSVCGGEGSYDGGYGYPMSCVVCGGSGLFECAGCAGTGQVKQYNFDDSYDGGGGIVSPNTDIFDGGSSSKNCVKCNNTGTIICTFCEGTGGWDNTNYAPDFSGNGGNSYSTTQKCYTCSGKGIIDCPYCY